MVECENLGCHERMIKKEMEEHILECELGKVHCKYCAKDYFRRDIENHVYFDADISYNIVTTAQLCVNGVNSNINMSIHKNLQKNANLERSIANTVRENSVFSK